MKKLLLIALIAFSINANAQITLKHDYDSAATIASGSPAVLQPVNDSKFYGIGRTICKNKQVGKMYRDI